MGVTVSDESFAKLWDDSNSVRAGQAANSAHHRVIIGIQDHHLRAVRDVYAACVSIDRNVVVIFIAAGRRGQRNLLNQVVTSSRRFLLSIGAQRRANNEQSKEQNYCKTTKG